MNFKILLAVLMVIFAGLAKSQNAEPTFDKKKASYAIGYRMGIEFTGRQGSEFELDVEEAIKGIRDSAAKKDPAVSKEDMVLNVQGYEKKMQMKQMEMYKKLAEENKKRSDGFLAENRKKKGIKELPSGVQYRVIEDGVGNHPTMDSEVTIHYRGSLIGTEDVNNYQEFDSTFIRGEPRTLKVSEGLKGWQEILPLMRPGGKWQVYIPPELGFGIRGQSPIGPNEVLVFDITLLSINK